MTDLDINTAASTHPQKVEMIGYDCGWGSNDHTCEDGASAAPIERLLYRLRHHGFDPHSRGTLGIKFIAKRTEINGRDKTLPLVIEAARRLCNHVNHAVTNGHIPVIFGGDHTSAIGTWSGLGAALKSTGNIGLIWMSPHSGLGDDNSWWHRQALAALLGHSIEDLAHIGGKAASLTGKHISLIGPTGLGTAEEKMIRDHGITLYTAEDIKTRGLAAIYAEAINHATNGTAGFGLSIDLGALCSDRTGLTLDDVLPIIRGTAHNTHFRALEIAEFSPSHDKNATLGQIEGIVDSVFAKT